MNKLLGLTCFAILLVACGPTPNNSNPSASPSPGTSASPGASSSPAASPNPTVSASAGTTVGSTTPIAQKELKQSQFLAAMKCAAAKDPENAAIFNANVAVVSGWDASTWQLNVDAGGGGQYVAYKQAAARGCNGN